MTYTTHIDRAKRGALVWQPLPDLRKGLAQRLARYQAYRSTVRELHACSDRELTDMGIHRADIHAIARQAAYEAP